MQVILIGLLKGTQYYSLRNLFYLQCNLGLLLALLSDPRGFFFGDSCSYSHQRRTRTHLNLIVRVFLISCCHLLFVLCFFG